jgi:hypothetical protein
MVEYHEAVRVGLVIILVGVTLAVRPVHVFRMILLVQYRLVASWSQSSDRIDMEKWSVVFEGTRLENERPALVGFFRVLGIMVALVGILVVVGRTLQSH